MKTSRIFVLNTLYLQDVVRRLKKYFNTKFDKAFQEKEEILEKIGHINERLKAVISELR